MIITPHALTGLLIATSVERLRFKNSRWDNTVKLITLACILSFFSHFLLDAIPHYDYEISPISSNFYKLLIDMIFLFTISSILYWKQLKTTAHVLQTPMGRLSEPGIKINLRYLSLFPILGLSAFSTLLPDILVASARYSPAIFLARFTRFHNFFHSQVLTRSELGIGIFIQVLFSLFVIFFIVESIKKLDIDLIGKNAGEEAESWLSVTSSLK